VRINTRWIQLTIVSIGGVIAVGSGISQKLAAQEKAQPSSYAPVDIHEPFASIMNRMSAAKADIMKKQIQLDANGLKTEIDSL